ASGTTAATGGGSSGNPSAATGPSASRPSGPPRAEPVRADPPVKFTQVVAGSGDADVRPLVLDGLDVVSVVGMESLVSYDVRDGKQTAEMTSRGKLPEGSLYGWSTWMSGGLEPARPAVGTSGGKRYAVAAFPLTITGRGTISDHYGVEVDILDLDTHKEAGRVTIDGDTIGKQVPAVAGIAAGRALVVAASLSGPPTSYAIDLATGTVAWKAANYEAQVLQGDTVVGVSSLTGGWDTYLHHTPLEVRALSTTDGAIRWKALTGEVQTNLSVFATDKILARGEREPTLLSTGTGESLPLPALTEKYTLDTSSCRFDGRATTVCRATGTDGGQLLGIDAAGVTVLWQIVSSAGAGARVAPSVTAVWHGAVYGRAQNGKNVVLDARTGQDREYEPGTAPDHVNEYAALSGDTFYLSAG
ncbi:PQQ-binding-like beta-propeller repeat protein, partial [Streptomyces sp. NRRL S-495]|uniref:outer membrane protein assembly factor BamB family protein n=1 Tax=Streptomyces sp. NRRL S-495 TaxID=1609133 RepID=UPI0005F91A74